MQEIDVAITTVARSENYIGDTLSSLGSDIPIKLVLGSPSASHLLPYQSDSQYTIISFTEKEWDCIADKTIWQRASWNYWRCLSSKIVHNRGVIIFEDDVRVTRGWRERFDDTIREIESRFGQNYVLSLYSPYRRTGYKDGFLFEGYKVQYFFGTQGMYFSERIRIEFSEYIHKFGVLSYRTPYDLLLKDYLVSSGVRLFATSPSLVQHIGANTTGLGGNFHRAPSFLESVL